MNENGFYSAPQIGSESEALRDDEFVSRYIKRGRFAAGRTWKGEGKEQREERKTERRDLNREKKNEKSVFMVVVVIWWWSAGTVSSPQIDSDGEHNSTDQRAGDRV